LKLKHLFQVVIFLLLIPLMVYKTVQAEKPVRILILPFNIHSEKDLSFLIEGIEDMFSTRLTLENKIIPISREQTRQVIKDISEPISQKIAISLGEKLQADYVIYGSVTVLGNSISTDARFLDTRKNKDVATFYETGENNSDVIFHINRFAAQVNETVFGRKAGEESSYETASPEPSIDSSRKHPETLWLEKKKELEEKKEAPAAPKTEPSVTDESESVPSVSPEPEPVLSKETEPESYEHEADSVKTSSFKPSGKFWKSESFKMQIRSMAIGDVDGDSKNEIVFIDDKNLLVYRNTDGRFEKVGDIEGSGTYNFIGVDVADINRNGKSEIFVTNLNKHTDNLKSFVMEWNGRDFSLITDKSSWYYRVIQVPEQGNILIGQKRGIRDIFTTGIEELKWKDGEYVPVKEHILPLWINVFGFTYGDIMNTGHKMIAAFAENEHIRVLNMNGSEEWRSSEPLGGSMVYLNSPAKGSPSIDSVMETERRYLPQRLFIGDFDKDGKYELIVGKNKDSAGRVFSKLRFFKSGHIEALGWDQAGLYQKWQTREITGHISDYAIGDIDNDGDNELVFSVVAKIASVLSSSKSFIISQDFPKGTEKKE